ncbi:DUF2690 domain-containing protein [Gordonia desulfuricans]
MVFAILPAAPQAAAAPSCYGDYCSGKNPYSTGCSANSYRWGSATVRTSSPGSSYYDQSASAGRLELWISRSCATRWARLVLTDHAASSGSILAVVQSDGYRKAHAWQPREPGTYYTAQIYSRNKCSRAVYGGWSTGCTVW